MVSMTVMSLWFRLSYDANASPMQARTGKTGSRALPLNQPTILGNTCMGNRDKGAAARLGKRMHDHGGALIGHRATMHACGTAQLAKRHHHVQRQRHSPTAFELRISGMVWCTSLEPGPPAAPREKTLCVKNREILNPFRPDRQARSDWQTLSFVMRSRVPVVLRGFQPIHA